MNYQEALAFMSKAKDINKGRPTGQRGTRMFYDLHYKTKLPVVLLKYHDTFLVQWTHDRTLFTNNGWKSRTTLSRICEHLRHHGYTIYRKKGVMYLYDYTDNPPIPLNPCFTFYITREGDIEIEG